MRTPLEKLKVHYAPVELQGDIPVKEFDYFRFGVINFMDWLYDEINFKKEVVWVLSTNEEVFVTNSVYSIQLFLSNLRDFYDMNKDDNLYIQEYNSYEEAYRIALAMKEPNKLCYED